MFPLKGYLFFYNSYSDNEEVRDLTPTGADQACGSGGSTLVPHRLKGLDWQSFVEFSGSDLVAEFGWEINH